MSLDGGDDGTEGFPLSVYHYFPLQPLLAYQRHPKALVAVEDYNAGVTTNNEGANEAVPGRYGEGQSVGRLSVAAVWLAINFMKTEIFCMKHF
jgi:hypothetical protein